jgi:predicted restriction endonuclease
MVICERVQYALKNGILDLCSPMALRETQALIIREEQKAEDTGAFNPLGLKDDRQRTIATIVRRRGQPEFRQRLLCAYGNRCAVTGCDAIEALEAAHIVPYQGENTDHVSNGVILRSDVHTLFDLGLLTIDADSWMVVLRSELLGTTYGQLHGRRISLPVATTDMPSRDALRLHRTDSGL